MNSAKVHTANHIFTNIVEDLLAFQDRSLAQGPVARDHLTSPIP